MSAERTGTGRVERQAKNIFIPILAGSVLYAEASRKPQLYAAGSHQTNGFLPEFLRAGG